MQKIDRILKQLSELYEFNRRIKGYYRITKKKEDDLKRSETATSDRRTFKA